MRWAAEPTEAQKAAARAAFDAVRADWVPLDFSAPGALCVFEHVPFMHIPHDDGAVWWRGGVSDALTM